MGYLRTRQATFDFISGIIYTTDALCRRMCLSLSYQRLAFNPNTLTKAQDSAEHRKKDLFQNKPAQDGAAKLSKTCLPGSRLSSE